jgi:parallel beta-helix repeat protein
VSDPANDLAPNERIAIKNVSITAQEVGVDFVNTTSSSVAESRIKNIPGNQFALGIGIHFEGAVSYNPTAESSHNEIIENTISSNENGIIVESGAVNNVVLDNVLYNNTFCDICANKTQNTIIGNTVVAPNKSCLCRRAPPINPLCPVQVAAAFGNASEDTDILDVTLGAIASHY